MNDKKEYIAPELTVVSFKVEQGFFGSGQKAFSLFPFLGIDAFNNQSQEVWSEGGDFGGDWRW